MKSGRLLVWILASLTAAVVACGPPAGYRRVPDATPAPTDGGGGDGGGGDGGGDDATSGDARTDGGCPAPATMCDGRCTNTQTDNTNCGRCGNACAAGATCVGGVCQSSCAAPRMMCGASCVDVRTDPANCGACGNACGAGGACAAGVCQTSCAAPRMVCDGVCVDVQSNASHCGFCGTRCVDGGSCVGGRCQAGCSFPMMTCAGSCVDTRTDARNCGACGNVCGPGATCDSGVCRVSCAFPRMTCGGACVDVQTDPTNCGSCGNVCAPGATCTSGVCRTSGCAFPMTMCGTSCVDLQSNASHCGFCGNACSAGTSCVSGTCRAASTYSRYTQSSVASSFLNACSLGGARVLASIDDSTSTATLPFQFTFYSTRTSSVWFSSNGVVGFGTASSAYSNTCLPSSSAITNAIFGYWDDLVTRATGVCHTTTGSPGSRQFVVTWNDVQLIGMDTTHLTFSIVLTEGSNLIEVQYQLLTGANGSGATVGVQNATGTVATQVQCDPTTGALRSGLTYRFTPQP